MPKQNSLLHLFKITERERIESSQRTALLHSENGFNIYALAAPGAREREGQCGLSRRGGRSSLHGDSHVKQNRSSEWPMGELIDVTGLLNSVPFSFSTNSRHSLHVLDL